MKKLAAVIILIGFTALTGCGNSSGKVAHHRDLTPEELEPLSGRNQFGASTNRVGQVESGLPIAEPVLEWMTTLDSSDCMFLPLVDSEGGIWFTEHTKSGVFKSDLYQSRVVRLNPDGTRDWDRKLLPDGYTNVIEGEDNPDWIIRNMSHCYPAVVLNGATVIFCLREEKKYENKGLAGLLSDNRNEEINCYWFMECLDYDGETIWKTENVSGKNDPEWMPVRIPSDMIIMPSSEGGIGVYNLASGKLIKSIILDGFDVSYFDSPIALEVEGWIAKAYPAGDTNFLGTTLVRADAEGQVLWSEILGNKHDQGAGIVFGDTTYIQGTRSGMRYFDLLDGSDITTVFPGELSLPVGIDYSGNLIAERIDVGSRQVELVRIGTNEQVEWSTDIPGTSVEIAIFPDDSFMIGHQWGISYFTPNGDQVWTLDFDDLGLGLSAPSEGFNTWALNPQPDGGLLASGIIYGLDDFRKVVFKMRPQ